MQIRINKFDKSIDLNKISQFSYLVQNTTGYLEEDTTLESIREELEEARDNYKFILFEGYENNQLIGILLLFTNTPKFGLIWDWHPFVLPNTDKSKNAIELIKECIEFAEKNDIIRIEVCFTIQNNEDKQKFISRCCGCSASR